MTADLRGQVREMAACGLAEGDIAALVNLPVDELRRHYGRELSTAAALANIAVVQSLFRMATDPANPNAEAAIFWLDRRGGAGGQ